MKIFVFKKETMNNSSMGRNASFLLMVRPWTPQTPTSAALPSPNSVPLLSHLRHQDISLRSAKPSFTAPQKTQLIFEKLFKIS